MNIDQFVSLLGQEKATAILRTDNQEKAALAMQAAIRGGFKVVEFTLTVPGVYELIQEFSDRDDVVVGAKKRLRQVRNSWSHRWWTRQ